MANSNLNDEQLAYLYEKYYSSEEALKNVMDAKIPVKDFIRFNETKRKGSLNVRNRDFIFVLNI